MTTWMREGDTVPQRGEKRYDKHGEIRAMAYADGWVMVQPDCRCMPIVMSLAKWNDLDTMPVAGKITTHSG